MEWSVALPNLTYFPSAIDLPNTMRNNQQGTVPLMHTKKEALPARLPLIHMKHNDNNDKNIRHCHPIIAFGNLGKMSIAKEWGITDKFSWVL